MAKGERAARLQTEIVVAMKAKDKQRLGVLRMMQAAVKQVEIDTREELDDDGVVQVLTAYARKVKDQIKSFGEGGRDELLAKAEAELVLVSEYLPAELTDDELAVLVAEAVAETGAAGPADMGRVMKAVLPRVAGRADGGRVSALVKKTLLP